MRKDLYKEMDSIGDKHWWFVGRAEILKTLIKKIVISKDNDSLDIGSGPGINLATINSISKNLTCIEASTEAVGMIKEKFPNIKVLNGFFPEIIPDEKFDLVTMFDALEHIDDDIDALKKLNSIMRNGARIIITVPAFMFLWSEHDEHAHHKRRYTKEELISKLESAGFEIERSTYFNFLLFSPISMVRIIKKMFKIETNKSDFEIGSNFLNKILTYIFMSESIALKHINFPIGVSIFCAARKK